jgi:acyl carrier protein
MTRQENLEKLADILSELFETPREKVVPEATLYEDLDLDSIDAIDLVLKLQALTGHPIVPQDFKHVRTVNDVLDCIEKLLASDEPPA